MVMSAVPRFGPSIVMEPTIATMMLIVNTIHKSSEKERARTKEGRMGKGGKEGGEERRKGRVS